MQTNKSELIYLPDEESNTFVIIYVYIKFYCYPKERKFCELPEQPLEFGNGSK